MIVKAARPNAVRDIKRRLEGFGNGIANPGCPRFFGKEAERIETLRCRVISGPADIERGQLLGDRGTRQRTFVAEPEDREGRMARAQCAVRRYRAMATDDGLRHQEQGQVKRKRWIIAKMGGEDLPALRRQLVDQNGAEFGAMVRLALIPLARLPGLFGDRPVGIDDRLFAVIARMDAGFAVVSDIDESTELRPDCRIDRGAAIADMLDLRFDRGDPVIGRISLGGAVDEVAFELVDEVVCLGLQRCETRAFLFGRIAPHRIIGVIFLLEIVGHLGRDDRGDEGIAMLRRNHGGGCFELFLGEPVEHIGIDPGFAIGIGEEVGVDPPARSDIGIAPDIARLGVASFGGAVEDGPADIVGVVAVIAVLHLLEDRALAVGVSGDGIGHGGGKGDLARAQRLADSLVEVGKPQALFDIARGLAGALADVLRARPPLHEIPIGLAFIDRVHGDALGVFDQAGADGVVERCVGIGLEHQHRNLVIGGKDLLFDQQLQRAQAPPAGSDAVMPGLLERGDDEIVEQALFGDGLGQLLDRYIAATLAHIVPRQRKVPDLDGLDHRFSPIS